MANKYRQCSIFILAVVIGLVCATCISTLRKPRVVVNVNYPKLTPARIVPAPPLPFALDPNKGVWLQFFDKNGEPIGMPRYFPNAN